jgi:hypothetical protein
VWGVPDPQLSSPSVTRPLRGVSHPRLFPSTFIIRPFAGRFRSPPAFLHPPSHLSNFFDNFWGVSDPQSTPPLFLPTIGSSSSLLGAPFEGVHCLPFYHTRLLGRSKTMLHFPQLRSTLYILTTDQTTEREIFFLFHLPRGLATFDPVLGFLRVISPSFVLARRTSL